MNTPSFRTLFADVWKLLVYHPLLFIPGLLLFFGIQIFSFISVWVIKQLSGAIGGNTASYWMQTGVLGGWSLFISIILLGLFSFCFTSLIQASFSLAHHQKARTFISSHRLWLKNCVLMGITLAVGFVLWASAYYGTFALGRVLALSLPYAQALFFLLLFSFFCGFLLFFSFSSFFFVRDNKTLFSSIRQSFSFTRRHYLWVLVFSVILYLLGVLFDLLGDIAASLLTYVLVVPFLSVFIALWIVRSHA